MLIRSDPPGAKVYVDEYEVGTTPVAHSFTYYGTRKIRLVKDGYETLTVMQPIRAPWYEIPPLDFVSENLIPGKLYDPHVLEYRLTPQMVVPTEQLLGRAEGLRRGTYAVSPAGAVTGQPPAGPGRPEIVLPPPPSPGAYPAPAAPGGWRAPSGG